MKESILRTMCRRRESSYPVSCLFSCFKMMFNLAECQNHRLTEMPDCQRKETKLDEEMQIGQGGFQDLSSHDDEQ